MRFEEILWRQTFAEKIIEKHQVQLDEVEEVPAGKPFIKFQERCRRRGEDLYVAYGRTRCVFEEAGSKNH